MKLNKCLLLYTFLIMFYMLFGIPVFILTPESVQSKSGHK